MPHYGNKEARIIGYIVIIKFALHADVAQTICWYPFPDESIPRGGFEYDFDAVILAFYTNGRYTGNVGNISRAVEVERSENKLR